MSSIYKRRLLEINTLKRGFSKKKAGQRLTPARLQTQYYTF